MRRTRSTGAGRAWAALLLCVLGAGCRLAPAKVWNLEQLHEPDGRPRREGVIKGDLTYLLTQGVGRTGFGGPDFQAAQSQAKRIEDPLGTCLENVVELALCGRDDKVIGLQAAAFAWLGVDCTYLLSRERCVLELGELARLLDVPGNPAPPEGEPLSPEAVKERFDGLVATAREVAAAPELAGAALETRCDEIRALALDRAGALRLLRASNALLEGGGLGAVFAPLRALRAELARRCITLALREAAGDPHGRVRAAALESSVRAFPDERAVLLRQAMLDPMEGVEARGEVTLRALELVARLGLPPPPEGESPADFARGWRDLLAQVLRMQVDGAHTTAACRALAKVTGEPASLRPEVWLARWRAAGAERAGAAPEDAGAAR